jgi:adenylate kinase
LALDVSREELVKRLLQRGLTSGRPDDVNESIISNRIVEYHTKTTVVANYYSKFDKVVHVKGEGTVDDIFTSLRSEIDKRLSI